MLALRRGAVIVYYRPRERVRGKQAGYLRAGGNAGELFSY
jgi:hypothetical protein